MFLSKNEYAAKADREYFFMIFFHLLDRTRFNFQKSELTIKLIDLQSKIHYSNH